MVKRFDRRSENSEAASARTFDGTRFGPLDPLFSSRAALAACRSGSRCALPRPRSASTALVALSRNRGAAPQLCSMKITADVPKYAAEQAISGEDALKRGMEEKSREFAGKDSDVYAKS